MPAEELHLKYRPRKWDDVVGQEDAIRSLMEHDRRGTIPHSLLITGPSGCGKTTLGRILKTRLHCDDADFEEVNSARFRGIDTIRSIQQNMNLRPMAGKTRMYLVDEVHQMTPPAQDAFLKALEEPPGHVYFVLCTTEPNKLIRTLRSRCTHIQCVAISDRDLNNLVARVAKREGIKLTRKVMVTIVRRAEGSAREALVHLNTIRTLSDPKDQVDALGVEAAQFAAIEICRLLMNDRNKWKDLAKVLKGCNEDAERVRRAVLGYAMAVLLKTDNPRAHLILETFADHFYDSGKPGLVAACYSVLKERE